MTIVVMYVSYAVETRKPEKKSGFKYKLLLQSIVNSFLV